MDGSNYVVQLSTFQANTFLLETPKHRIPILEAGHFLLSQQLGHVYFLSDKVDHSLSQPWLGTGSHMAGYMQPTIDHLDTNRCWPGT